MLDAGADVNGRASNVLRLAGPSAEAATAVAGDAASADHEGNSLYAAVADLCFGDRTQHMRVRAHACAFVEADADLYLRAERQAPAELQRRIEALAFEALPQQPIAELQSERDAVVRAALQYARERREARDLNRRRHDIGYDLAAMTAAAC